MDESFDNIRGLILDMDGVLWRDEQPLVELSAIFKQVESRNIKFVFATNNSTLSVDQYIQKLDRFGLAVKPWQVINSPQAVVNYLQSRHPDGGAIYIIGESGLIHTLEERGFYPSQEGVVAVIVGMDRSLTYSKLSDATLLIRSGVPFVGTNPDKTFPTPKGLAPGAGAILAALEASTGTKPVIVGKPASEMYSIALKRMGTSPEETLVVGDRLETDIAGGQALHCLTALVLSGVSTREDADGWHPKPDLVVTDLSELLNQI